MLYITLPLINDRDDSFVLIGSQFFTPFADSNPCMNNPHWTACDHNFGGCTVNERGDPSCFCRQGYSPVQRDNFTRCNGRELNRGITSKTVEHGRNIADKA